MSKEMNQARGVGFLGLLMILFIALKLTDNIDWSWLWVLCPLWAGTALVVGVLVAVGIVILLASLWDWTIGSMLVVRHNKRRTDALYKRRHD